MNQPVIDYFRCPENFTRLQLAGPLSSGPGYFSFGAHTICYGNSSSGFRSSKVTGLLHDILTDVNAAEDGTVQLTLNPNEIVENLRHERYCLNKGQILPHLSESPLIRAIYYSLRPHLPV